MLLDEPATVPLVSTVSTCGRGLVIDNALANRDDALHRYVVWVPHD